jgi:DNA-binding XRE family transcriptional regulator
MSWTARKIAKVSPRAMSSRLGTVSGNAASRHAWPDDVANTLARRIAWYRELRGYTQAALAERAGLSPTTVNDAESGQTRMDLRTIMTLAAALETTVGTLLGEVERAPEALAADAKKRRF